MSSDNFHEVRRNIYHIAATKGIDDAINHIDTLNNFSDHQLKLLYKAANFENKYKEEGVVVIRRIIDENLVKESVEEIWNRVIDLPWKKRWRKQWSKLRDDFVENPWRAATSEELKLVKKIYPMTGGFGALTLPPAFHHHTQWEIRQNSTMVAIAKVLLRKALKICETEEVMVTYDRISFKFKGQGETEFTHWDSAGPHGWKDEEYVGMQGIVALSDTSFFAVPGSHTKEFGKNFIRAAYHKPTNKRMPSAQYFVTKGYDPLNLQGQVKEYKLKKGDWVVWSNRVLHEARKNKSHNIRYGYYISYFPYNCPPEVVRNYYENNDIDFEEERRRSFNNGTNPTTFPSGFPVKLYSKMHLMCHPNILDEFCGRFTTGWEEYTYDEGKKKGQVVNLPIGWNPKELDIYEPIKLSKVGKMLI